MRKRIFCAAIVALIASGLSSQGFCMASRPPVSKKSTSKQVEPIQKILGKVSGYDWMKSIITIAPINGASVAIEIDKVTKISKSGIWLKMADIKTGDEVVAVYETKGGKKIAKTIIVQEKTAAKAAIPEKKKR